jgi:hypothetical protein
MRLIFEGSSPQSMKKGTRRILAGSVHGYLTAATAFVALLAQLSSIADLALFRHVVCPEHGELVHLEEEAAPSPGLAATPSNRGQVDVSIQAKAQWQADGRHDHCSLAAHRREIATGARTKIPVSEVAQSLAVARIAEHAPRSSPVPIFRLAPKNSPPIRS